MVLSKAAGEADPASIVSLLETAEATIKQHNIEPTVLIAKWLQKANDDPVGANRDAVEHAHRMGVPDIDAEVQKLVHGTPYPFIRFTGKPTHNIQKVNIVSSVEVQLSPPDTEMNPNDIQRPLESEQRNTTTQAPSKYADPAKRKRKQSQYKNGGERSKSSKLSTKSGSKSASPATGFAAESSKSGATREAAATASEPMNVDYTPPLFVGPADPYPLHATLPKWYLEISPSNFNMIQLGKKRTPAMTSLDNLKDCISRCVAIMLRMRLSSVEKLELAKRFDELRDHVHKAESKLDVTKYIIKHTRILTPENGLPRIFKEDADFPNDLKADSYLVYSKWINQDFATNILRGITVVKGDNRGSDCLDPKYRNLHPTSFKVYGNNGLVLGQWWPTQLCTVRDGAHGSSQGGISGAENLGAFSIILSGGGGYHDVDEGDVIQYSGTDGKDGEISLVTQHMITSASLGNEIRVIRSAGLSKSNIHRPECGFRYDGLYKIVPPFKVVDQAKQKHIFTLHRCPGQEPIRCENNLAQRPTKYQIEQFKASKEKFKWS
jgi:hypothetical protein